MFRCRNREMKGDRMLFKSPRLIRLRKPKFFLFIIGMLLTMTTACAKVKYRIPTEESEEIPEPEQ